MPEEIKKIESEPKPVGEMTEEQNQEGAPEGRVPAPAGTVSVVRRGEMPKNLPSSETGEEQAHPEEPSIKVRGGGLMWESGPNQIEGPPEPNKVSRASSGKSPENLGHPVGAEDLEDRIRTEAEGETRKE